MELMGKTFKETKYKKYCICRSTDGSSFMICCDGCEEWFHGFCVNITEKESTSIKYWFCHKCSVDGDNDVQLFKNMTSKKKYKSKKQRRNQRTSSKENFSCKQCSNCLQNIQCGNKNYYLMKKLKNKKDTILNEINNQETMTSNKLTSIRGQKRDMYFNEEQKQCIGMNCIKSARPNSKYCSDDCGMALNRLRITSILQTRILEKGFSIADQIDHYKLRSYRESRECAINNLSDLDKTEMALSELITKAKSLPVVETEEDTRGEDEQKMYCVTCGWEIPSRTAVRHMELCFKKVESKCNVVGDIKANSEYCNIFCDFYNSSTKTYCRRLRYVCPNHRRPPKAKENEVCGCPIVEIMSKNICFNMVNKFCQKLKKNCYMHFNWENLFLADIDLSRMREMQKIERLSKEEALIHSQLENRYGALGLLLHSTS